MSNKWVYLRNCLFHFFALIGIFKYINCQSHSFSKWSVCRITGSFVKKWVSYNVIFIWLKLVVLHTFSEVFISSFSDFFAYAGRYPVKLFRRVMHNFSHFLPVLWHYRRHVIYRRILYTIMQLYMPIKLWTVIAAKTIVLDDKAASMQRYIAAEYIMLHNVI